MELWIRSQDKKRLGKIELIEYQEDDYGFYLFGWKDKLEGTRLAIYSTKERTLEVLDEIQRKIDYIYELSLRPRALTTIEHKIVYEMPNE